MTAKLNVFMTFPPLILILNNSEGYSQVTSVTLTSNSLCFLFCFNFPFQIQNADDVLITPLEKFRKEQIGAAKVSDHLHAQLASE